FMYQAAKGQAVSISSLLGGKAAESAKIAGTVSRAGKECFEIESTLAPEAVAALAKASTPEAKPMLPAGFRYVIDKQSYLMVEMATISRTGSVLSKSEFKDITPQPDLLDSFFLLPVGLDVKQPRSIGEYMSLVSDLQRSQLAPMAPAPLAPAPMRAAAPPPRTAEPKKLVARGEPAQDVEPKS